MKTGSFKTYRGFRIDCCAETRGCYKIRHLSGDGYLIMDYDTVEDAERFIDNLRADEGTRERNVFHGPGGQEWHN
jgi:hypothetical protein